MSDRNNEKIPNNILNVHYNLEECPPESMEMSDKMSDVSKSFSCTLAGLTHGLEILSPERSPNPVFGRQIRQKEATMYRL